MRRPRPSADMRRPVRALVLVAAALMTSGGRPAADALLAAEPPELVERLREERVLVLEEIGGEGPESFIVAYVLFERGPEEVAALLRQAERQPEYRPELSEVRTVRELPDGRVDEQRIRILFSEMVYRLRYREDPASGRMEWRLDPDFDNDLRRMRGFWELYAFEGSPDRTLGRFGSDVDVGRMVPGFLQRGLSRKAVLDYLRNCRRWIDSDGEWRP